MSKVLLDSTALKQAVEKLVDDIIADLGTEFDLIGVVGGVTIASMMLNTLKENMRLFLFW